MPSNSLVLPTIPKVDRDDHRMAHRRQLNREINRKILTERISGGNILSRLALIERQLMRNDNGKGGRLTSDDVRRLALVADISFKKLAKVLPDLHRSEGTITHQVIDRDTLIAEAQALGLPMEFVFGERGITIEHGPTQESS